MFFNEKILLSNGVEIPKLGLGTWFIPDDHAAEAVKQAINIGYRLIDTAQAYGNETGIGIGIRECKIPRNELFIGSKIAAEHKSYDAAMKSIDETLNKMQLDYLDLMIIHSPQPWKEVNQSENRYYEENKMVWKALEDSYKAGKVRAIGISNFMEKDIDNLWESAEIKPMLNQVLCHISNTPVNLIKYCKSKGIVMEAYSPVAHGEALKNIKIREVAEKYGVSVPQLCIRYDIQLGMIAFPKTSNPEHMKANSEIDFIISDEDMELLMNVEKIKDYGEYSNFPVFGGKK